MREAHQHYLVCRITNNTRIAVIMRQRILRWMRKMKTDPRLILLINRVFGKTSRNETDEMDPTTWEDEVIKKLIEDQNKIGWMNLFKGRLTKLFREVQDRYYREKNKKLEELGMRQLGKGYQASIWIKGMIKQIVFYALNMWQLRNEVVHEGSDMKKLKKKRDETHRNIIKWYEKKDMMGKEFDYLYKEPLITRCLRSQRNNEAWLRTIELEYNRSRGTV